MSALEDDALTVLLVKVVRDRLALLDDAARARLKDALRPGARHIVGLPDDPDLDCGGITRTKPAASKPLPTVTDEVALLEWVRLLHPTETWFPPAPAEQVRPAFRTWLLAAVAKGETVWCDANGEPLDVPPGVEWKAKPPATSTLQVRTTPEGDAALLAALRDGRLALPAVLDDVPAALEAAG